MRPPDPCPDGDWYEVHVQRTEAVRYRLRATDPHDAAARALRDGDEVASNLLVERLIESKLIPDPATLTTGATR